jgi:hypothetical protein
MDDTGFGPGGDRRGCLAGFRTGRFARNNHGNPDSVTRPDSGSYPYAYSDSNSNSHTDSYAYPYAYPDSNPDSHTDSNSNSDSSSNSHTDADADSYAHSGAYPDLAGRRRAGAGL